MSKKISALILDWAGTTVDYGCFATVGAFIESFEAFGLTPTMDETRAPMGMQKRAHIRTMLEGKRLGSMWVEKHGRAHNERDIDEIYSKFEPALFSVLENYSDPLPGAVEAVKKIREMGILIGSTTGYTKAMMDVLTPLVKEKGYAPDCVVCPDETNDMGRPFPYMIWRNLEKLRIEDVRSVLKVGDTTADMEEGKNAGCICVGILKGSSMIGLSEKELRGKSRLETESLLKGAERKYYGSGADYVISDITALPELVLLLNERKS